MTIQFLRTWNGYEAGQTVTLGGGEESRLIGLGLARAWYPGMDGVSDDGDGVEQITSGQVASPTTAMLSIERRFVTWVSPDGKRYRSDATATAVGTALVEVGAGGGGGATTYASLTDKTTIDLPATNTPLANALSVKQGVPVVTAWATAWDMTAQKDMGLYTMVGPLALTATDAGSVLGGSTVAVIRADGANVPTLSGVAAGNWVNSVGQDHVVMLNKFGAGAKWIVTPPPPVAPAITVVPVVSASLTTGVVFAAATASGSPAPTLAYDLVDGSNAVITAGVVSGFTASAATGRKIKATATNSQGSAIGYSVPFDIVAAPTIIGNAARAPAASISAGVTETGDATYGWRYESTSSGAQSAISIRQADRVTAIPNSARVIYEFETDWATNIYLDFKITEATHISMEAGTAGIRVQRNTYALTALSALGTGTTDDTWVQGAGYASLAAHATNKLWSVKGNGSVLSLYSSLDRVSWVEIAKYNIPGGAFTTWGSSAFACSFTAIGQACRVSWSAS